MRGSGVLAQEFVLCPGLVGTSKGLLYLLEFWAFLGVFRTRQPPPLLHCPPNIPTDQDREGTKIPETALRVNQIFSDLVLFFS